jgi:Short-chain alcohol dehydrogenase of unknown specificity
MAVAIVTGAGSGIGAATAKVLSDRGDQVVCADVKLDAAQRTADELPDALAVEVDVRDAKSCDRMVDEAVRRFHDVNSIVTCAGVEKHGPGHEFSEEDFDWIIDVNLKGTMYAARASLPHLLESDAADFVALASEAGRRGLPHETVYCASKFGQVGFTRALDHEMREHGVRCTNVCPGGVATGFAYGKGRAPEDEIGMMTAQDVADLVMFVITRPRGMRILETALRPMIEGSWG